MLTGLLLSNRLGRKSTAHRHSIINPQQQMHCLRNHNYVTSFISFIIEVLKIMPPCHQSPCQARNLCCCESRPEVYKSLQKYTKFYKNIQKYDGTPKKRGGKPSKTDYLCFPRGTSDLRNIIKYVRRGKHTKREEAIGRSLLTRHWLSIGDGIRNASRMAG